MSIANKLSYLNETREQIREGLNKLGGQISPNDTFRSYADKIEEIYDSMPKVEESDVESGTLEGTIKGGLDINLKGNTSQDSTTGANIIDLSSYNYGTNNGVTTSYTNGKVKYNGQISGSGLLGTCYNVSNTYNAGTYYIKITEALPYTFVILDKDYNQLGSISSGNKETTIMPSSNFTGLRFYMRSGSEQIGQNVNITFGIMLATTDVPYEPYTNGASPNPDYPQDVHVVSGDNTIKAEGKNLFDIANWITKGNNGTYYSYSNGEVTIKQVDARGFNNFIQAERIYLPNGTYTISGIPNNSARIYNNDTDYPVLTNTFEVTLGYIYLKIVSSSVVTCKPMIESGNTSSTYQPYQSQTYPIYLGVLGKNLFNGIIESGGFDSNGLNVTPLITRLRSKDYIRVKPNTTYTVSTTNNDNSRTLQISISKYSVNDYTTPRISYVVWSSLPVTFTTDNNCNFIRLLYKYTNETTMQVSDISNEQVELGDEATTYEEYNPMELCKIGDYQDYFTKNSGKNLFGNLTNGQYDSNGDYQETSTRWCTPKIKRGNNNKLYFYKDTTSYYYCLVEFDSNGTLLNRETGIGNNTTNANKTFNANTDTFAVFFYDVASIDGMKLEISFDEITAYEHYGTGQWCKYNAIGKVVLDGSESWTKVGSSVMSGTSRFYNELSDIINGDNDTTNTNIYVISNYFKATYWYDVYVLNTTDKNLITNYNSNNFLHRIYLRTDDNIANDVATLQTWLSTHNTTVYYVLASPYLSLIEDETLISQLDNIQNAMSYEGTTNIGQVNNDLPFKLDLKAILDWRNNGGE